MATHATMYSNPVWPEYMADPFVLKTGQAYYAYGTGPASGDGMQFPVLRSLDLANWEYVGHALRPLTNPKAFTCWAPEVAEHNGRFYLYYSASTSESDEHHRLRVAVAHDPAGPFVDSGHELMPDIGFSIDASPFQDPQTGQWYLFFAADFTEDAPHGTGLAVVPLRDDMIHVAGKPQVAIRASCDWQVYERNRNYKGRVWEAWHCVEGPFCVFHDGRYYCLYSGGAWYTQNYGVGYAVADNPLGPYHDERAKHGPTVLKGIPGLIVGPGHNSVVEGPDGKTLYMVYHAWDKEHTARRMCIDPLVFTEDGPRCLGPTMEPRPVFV